MVNRILSAQRATGGNCIIAPQEAGVPTAARADLQLSYSVLASVRANLALSYVVLATVRADLTLSYQVLSNVIFVRAPQGAGYTPRRTEQQQRPAAIQRNDR